MYVRTAYQHLMCPRLWLSKRYACIFVYVYVYAHIYKHMSRICMYIYVHTHTQLRFLMHTYNIHTYIHTYIMCRPSESMHTKPKFLLPRVFLDTRLERLVALRLQFAARCVYMHAFVCERERESVCVCVCIRFLGTL